RSSLCLHSFPTRRSSDLLRGSSLRPLRFKAFGFCRLPQTILPVHPYILSCSLQGVWMRSFRVFVFLLISGLACFSQTSSSSLSKDRKSTRLNSSHLGISY